jgi:hypothetical protein
MSAVDIDGAGKAREGLVAMAEGAEVLMSLGLLLGEPG